MQEKRSNQNVCYKIFAALLAVIIVFASMWATADAAVKKPGKVSGLKVVKVSTSAVTLSWKKAKNVKKYEFQIKRPYKTWNKFKLVKKTAKNKKTYTKKNLYKVKVSGKKYQVYKYASAYTTTITKNLKLTIKGLKAGKTYKVRVRGINGKKKGAWSGIKTVKTKTVKAVPKKNTQPVDKTWTKYTEKGSSPVDKTWTKYTDKGSSIEWKVDDDHTLHIRPISGGVGIIKDANANYYTENQTYDDNGITRIWRKLNGIKRVTVDKGKIRLVGDCEGFFSVFDEAISIDVNGFDTSNLTDMTCMFYDCRKLESLDLSNFNTNNVKYMGGMFVDCRKLKSLDLSNFNTSNVVSMSYNFYGELSGDVDLWMGMFTNCISLESLNLSSFNTSKVKYMNHMFAYCRSLEKLDLSNFKTNEVKKHNMRGMFDYCSKLTDIKIGSNFSVFIEGISDGRIVYYEEDWEEKNEETYNTLSIKGPTKNIPDDLEIDFNIPGTTYQITGSDKTGYVKKLTASCGGETRVWYIKYERDLDVSFRIIDVIGYDKNDTENLLSKWYENWDDDGNNLLELYGTEKSIPANLKIDFGSSDVTYNITDSDKAGYVKKLTASYDGETRVWYIKYERNLDEFFEIKDVTGYAEDDTKNLLSDWYDYWYDDGDSPAYGVLELYGTEKNIPANLKIDFGSSDVTYNITDSDKAGYVKKLTVSYDGETRVWYIKYVREDLEAAFRIKDVIGYDKNDTENLLLDWDYGYDSPDYSVLYLYGTEKNIPANLKIDFGSSDVTYNITDSDKAGYVKKLTANYDGETRVWYIKYVRDLDLDEFFEIKDVIGYDKNDTENLLSKWYKNWDDDGNNLLELYGTEKSIPANLKIDFESSDVTYNITNSDKAGYAKKLTASYDGETRVWYIKYVRDLDLDEFFEIKDVTGYDKNDTENLLSDWYEDIVWDDDGNLLEYSELVLCGTEKNIPANLKIDFGSSDVTYNITDSDKAGYVKKLTASYDGETRVWYIKYERDLDIIFKIQDVIGYDEDETDNLISNWYMDSVCDDDDEWLYDELVLHGTEKDIPANLKFDFESSGVTYEITDSDKAGYAKKLTASYDGETRVWYIMYNE